MTAQEYEKYISELTQSLRLLQQENMELKAKLYDLMKDRY